MWKKCLAALLTMSMMVPIVKVKAADDLVVVIDPGHGGTELGANVKDANGKRVYEKNMNLKMASAMYNKLSQYAGVKVYMTRIDDSTVTLASRLKYAKSVGCDVLYSLHVNAKGDAQKETEGVSALISKGAYRPSLAKTAKGITDLALQYVTSASGMSNNGDLYRTSGSKKYANGAKADYYYIVRQATAYNFVGFIMEHGFIDNANDFNTLNDDDNLKLIGEADAQAVIDYYNLQLKGSEDNNSSENTDSDNEAVDLETPALTVTNTASGVALKWDDVDDASGYSVERKLNSWTALATTTATKLTDNKVTNGKKYSYRVKATTESDESEYSTKTIVYLSRNKIKSLKRKKRKVTIKWSRNKKATGYRVYYKKGSHTYYTTVKGNKKTSLTKSFKKGKYTFTVKCYNGTNPRYFSAASKSKTIRVK